MNVRAASKALNAHYKTIYNMIKDGRLIAEKTESGDWEISEAQVHEIITRSLGYGRKAEQLATAVYSLEEFKETFADESLHMVVEQCEQIAKDYEQDSRGRRMETALYELEERLGRLRIARNASEFMSLALQKANQYKDGLKVIEDI